MNSIIVKAIALLSLSLLCVGCAKPTPEGEIKKYEARVQAAESVKQDWPSMAKFVDEQVAASKADFESAKSANNLEALQAVNQNSMPLVKDLEQCRYKIKGCEDTIAKLRKLKLTKVEHERRRRKAADLDKDLADIQHALYDTQPTDAAAATKLVHDQVSALIALDGKCDRTYRQFNKSNSSNSKSRSKSKSTSSSSSAGKTK